MLFRVWSPELELLYDGGSWPMARAALDHVIMEDNGCPVLSIREDSDEETKP